ncbi:hypothetical protein BDCR2A_01514 [Borrelia duttonii CR2A]|uniref:Uncharacterized protein n=1 Tax=Borrelia duttonii CR2A TaxID=1432657 RepID=W6TWX8_9SPIR|nr:DUF1357 family protein [Borrelia duttonii]ETZ17571.1 hypothetical protein BDCR2A_01514 [Borrelia duttonii CR2A]
MKIETKENNKVVSKNVKVISKNNNVKSEVPTKTISLNEYNKYIKYKKELAKNGKQILSNKASKPLSINQRVAQELAEVKAKNKAKNKILQEAIKLNEIDSLSKKYLSSHFNKEALLSRGHSLDEIMLAQKRELVRKYVPRDQIKAIAKIDNLEHIKGTLLDMLVNLAKTSIKKTRKNKSFTTKITTKLTEEVELPKFYDWFTSEQIEEVPYKMGYFKTV